jgi:hypothetical protein
LEFEEKQRIRDRLIERAKYGEISGEEADRQAVKSGLDSFTKRPDPAIFDPEREIYWTLTMAVAWIACRTGGAVRESCAKYCAECWHWKWQRWRVGVDGEVHEGWFLEQWPRPTLVNLAIGEAIDTNVEGETPLVMTIKESREALWSALSEGFFEATGVDTKTDRRVAILATDWQELISVEGPGEVDEVRFGPMGRYGAFGAGYRDVLVPSKAIRGFWKAPRKKALELPSLVPPDGDGYIPLYCAAQWIASKGGAATFDPEDEANWRPAFAELLDVIASDKVRVVGTREGLREPVPGHHFADCEVEYPYCDPPAEMLWDKTLHLRSYPYLDQEHWRRGFDDALLNGFTVRWSRLMVAKQDVRGHWPFQLSRPNRSGAPGRPTSMHLVLEEFEKRCNAGVLEARIGVEAATLAAWLYATHPGAPSLTAKTIANNIRSKFRAPKA